MKNFEKYERSYFMPPEPCYDWAKKDYIEKPPIWCSVDLRDGNQALIEPSKYWKKKWSIFRCFWMWDLSRLKWDFRQRLRQSISFCVR